MRIRMICLNFAGEKHEIKRHIFINVISFQIMLYRDLKFAQHELQKLKLISDIIIKEPIMSKQKNIKNKTAESENKQNKPVTGIPNALIGNFRLVDENTGNTVAMIQDIYFEGRTIYRIDNLIHGEDAIVRIQKIIMPTK